MKKNNQSLKTERQLHLLNYILLQQEQLITETINTMEKFKERIWSISWEMNQIFINDNYTPHEGVINLDR